MHPRIRRIVLKQRKEQEQKLKRERQAKLDAEAAERGKKASIHPAMKAYMAMQGAAKRDIQTYVNIHETEKYVKKTEEIKKYNERKAERER